MNPVIQHVSVDGRDIQRLIFDKLVPTVEGEELMHSVLAMLTLVFILLYPDIKMDDLQKAVMNTSEFMIMQMMPAEGAAN